MKTKVLFTALAFSLSITMVQAQTFNNGDFEINAGIGLGYTYSIYSGTSQWPALVVSAEKGIRDIDNLGVLSVGGIIGYKHFSYSDADWSWSDLYIGARGAIHLNDLIQVDKLDVYGGASLGLRFYTYPTVEYNGYYDWEIKKKTFTKLFLGVFTGAKYSFSDKIAGFAELGYDIAWLKLGVAFKL